MCIDSNRVITDEPSELISLSFMDYCSVIIFVSTKVGALHEIYIIPARRQSYRSEIVNIDYFLKDLSESAGTHKSFTTSLQIWRA